MKWKAEHPTDYAILDIIAEVASVIILFLVCVGTAVFLDWLVAQ